jgi:hypothetical protein
VIAVSWQRVRTVERKSNKARRAAGSAQLLTIHVQQASSRFADSEAKAVNRNCRFSREGPLPRVQGKAVGGRW